MALPEPAPSEDAEKFVERCMSDEEMENEFPDYHQRLAVCLYIWDTKDEQL